MNPRERGDHDCPSTAPYLEVLIEEKDSSNDEEEELGVSQEQA